MMRLFAILVSVPGKTWIAEHAHGGPAIFRTEDDAFSHVEAIRATGVSYEVIELTATRISTQPTQA
jgi:hypothetical protein